MHFVTLTLNSIFSESFLTEILSLILPSYSLLSIPGFCTPETELHFGVFHFKSNDSAVYIVAADFFESFKILPSINLYIGLLYQFLTPET